MEYWRNGRVLPVAGAASMGSLEYWRDGRQPRALLLFVAVVPPMSAVRIQVIVIG